MSSSWMRGIRGFFVCGALKHRGRERHSREEVAEAIRKLKESDPSALITGEELDAIYNGETSDGNDGKEEMEGITDDEAPILLHPTGFSVDSFEKYCSRS